MSTRAIRPVSWPDTTCPQLWQRVRTAHFDQPDTPSQEVPGEVFCSNPRHAAHSALDEANVRQCMERGEGECWMSDWGPGERPPPD